MKLKLQYLSLIVALLLVLSSTVFGCWVAQDDKYGDGGSTATETPSVNNHSDANIGTVSVTDDSILFCMSAYTSSKDETGSGQFVAEVNVSDCNIREEYKWEGGGSPQNHSFSIDWKVSTPKWKIDGDGQSPNWFGSGKSVSKAYTELKYSSGPDTSFGNNTKVALTGEGEKQQWVDFLDELNLQWKGTLPEIDWDNVPGLFDDKYDDEDEKHDVSTNTKSLSSNTSNNIWAKVVAGGECYAMTDNDADKAYSWGRVNLTNFELYE